MSLKKLLQRSSPLALSMVLIACGEGSSVGTQGSAQEPLTGAANGTGGGAGEVAAASSVSGRVADGYINGATVCVDLNENDSCDADEPSAVSGEGGVYDLEIPAGAESKPIVAAIPAEAIDEDTGEAVGQALVFIAPADKPEFLSPITTLVHQELRANPALDVEDAEKAVKNILGIDETDVSLFVDYVAASKATDGAAGQSERFQYLHDTARVVASLMKDIETQVETAAVSKGVDVAGDANTQRAIRDIVRSEVRDLLPQIARQVAEIVNASDTMPGTEQFGEEDVERFDPQALAESLRPADAADNVEDRIEAAKGPATLVESDLKQLLSDGIYWMEFDCFFDEAGIYPEDVDVNVDVDQTAEPLADSVDGSQDVKLVNGYPMPICEALYGKVQLSADSQSIVSEQYHYEPGSGGWTALNREQDLGYADYALVDGQWIKVASEGPEGQIEFADDGSAVVSNDQGTMELKAATQALDGHKVIHHLLEDGADPVWFDIVDTTEHFSAGALTHKISVRQTYHPYVMFDHPPYSDTDQEQCADAMGNCNVVAVYGDDGQSYDLSSLSEVRELSLVGTSLVARTAGFGQETLMKLTAQPQDDGSLPTTGEVHWAQTSYHPAAQPFMPVDKEENYDLVDREEDYDVEFGPETGIYPAEYDEVEQCQYVLDNGFDEQGFNEADQRVVDENGLPLQSDLVPGQLDKEYCRELLARSGLSQDAVDVVGEDLLQPEKPGESEPNDADTQMLSSRWKLIEVQGVEMIEITLPLILRHDESVDTEEAILLIAHEERVRVGARLPETYIDRVFTYNENAFTTLKSIVEIGVDNQ